MDRIDTSSFADVAAELNDLRHRAASLDANDPDATADAIELATDLIRAVQALAHLCGEKIGEAARRE